MIGIILTFFWLCSGGVEGKHYQPHSWTLFIATLGYWVYVIFDSFLSCYQKWYILLLVTIWLLGYNNSFSRVLLIALWSFIAFIYFFLD